MVEERYSPFQLTPDRNKSNTGIPNERVIQRLETNRVVWTGHLLLSLSVQPEHLMNRHHGLVADILRSTIVVYGLRDLDSRQL